MLIGIMVLGAVVRLYHLGKQSLWVDEVLSVHGASDILQKGFWSQVFNPHGPICYYTVASVLPLGTAEWILRLPSAIFGIALVWVMYLLGMEIGGRRLGLMAGFVTALSPFGVWYSQEARYVSVFVLFAAASTLFTLRFATRARKRDLTGYVVTTLLMLLSFVGGVFLVLAQNVFAFCSGRRWPLIRSWLVGQVLLAMLFVPWLVQAYGINLNPWHKGRERSFSISALQVGNPRSPQLIQMGYALFTFGVGFSLGPSMGDLHENQSLEPVWKKKYEVGVAVLALGLALLGGLLGIVKTHRRGWLLVLSSLALPVFSPYALATVSGVVYNVRYASGAFPAYLLLLSAGLLWWFRRPYLGIATLAAVSGVMVLSLAMNYIDPEYFRDDNRGAARILREMRGPDEPLVVGPEDRALRYYYKGGFERWTKLELFPGSPQPGQGVALDAGRLWVASTRRWDVEFMSFLGRMRSCFPVEHDFNLPGFEVLAFRIDKADGPNSCTLRWKP